MDRRVPAATAMALALALALACAPRLARAQDLPAVDASAARPYCREGRVSTPATAGRCCWPGQHWSEDDARCAGPPTCPDDRAAEGDTCVPLANPPTAARPRRPRTITVRYLGGEVPSGGTLRARRHVGVMGVGALLLTAAYVPSFGTGVYGLTECASGSSYSDCYLAPWIIPAVGPLVSVAVHATEQYGPQTGEVALAALSSAFQVGGTALIVLGWRQHTWLTMPAPDADARASSHAWWTLLPAAPGAEIGASLLVAR